MHKNLFNKLCKINKLFFLLPAQIHEVSDGAENARCNEEPKGANNAIVAKSVTAEGGSNDRRNTADQRNHKIMRDAHFCKTHEVGQKILGRSGNEKEERYRRVSLVGIVEDRKRIDFFGGIQRLHEAASEFSCKENGNDTADRHTDKTKKRT